MHNSAVGGDGARLRLNQSAMFVNRIGAVDCMKRIACTSNHDDPLRTSPAHPWQAAAVRSIVDPRKNEAS
jgi:hypothetical protein